MNRALRLAALGILTVPGVALLGPAAWAQAAGAAHTVKPAVLQTAWYWQTAYQQVNPPVAPPAAPPSEPSGVPKGDIAVANTATDGSSSKMSAIAFQLGGLTSGATVTKFTLSLTLDSSGGATQVDSSAAPVLACLPTRMWTPAEGGSYTNEPSVDCSTSAKPTIKGSTYTYTIANVAQQWVGGPNLGVALVNDPSNTSTPFQTVFTAKSITATMSYTLPAVATPNGHTGQLGGTGTGNGNGSTNSAGTTAAAPPAPVTLPPSGPTTTTTPVTPAEPPQVATNTPVAPVAVRHADSSMPNTAFWVGALAIAVIIVVAGAVLADDNVPAPTATRTRLSRVLRARERARATTRTESPSTEGLKALSPRRV